MRAACVSMGWKIAVSSWFHVRRKMFSWNVTAVRTFPPLLYVLLDWSTNKKDWSGKPRFVGRNPRFPERFFSSVATTAFSCLVFLSHSRPLARAPWNSRPLFPFGFPFCFRSVALPPCLVFHHVTSRPSVVCLLLFPPFTSSWCGNELWFRHVSFVCGIQPVVHFWTFLRICFSSDLFETFSLKENKLDVSVKRYCSPSYTKGQACFFYPKQKTPLVGVFVYFTYFHRTIVFQSMMIALRRKVLDFFHFWKRIVPKFEWMKLLTITITIAPPSSGRASHECGLSASSDSSI